MNRLPIVTLALSQRETTKLGLGCAQLCRIPTSRQRQQLLACAFENGIRHFDVARMYGLGQAEVELGKFVARKRNQVTVFTKFGAGPPRYSATIRRLQAIPRWLFQKIPALKKTVVRASSQDSAARNYSLPFAQESLSHSLRSLKTDYLDALLLHDPPADAHISDELLSWLESQRRRGVIREYGVSGEYENVVAMGQRLPELRRITQFPSNALSANIQRYSQIDGESVITFGGVKSILVAVGSNGYLQLAKLVEGDKDQQLQALAEQAVLAGLLANPSGGVIVGSSNESHLKGIITAVRNRNSCEEWFKALVAAYQTGESQRPS